MSRLGQLSHQSVVEALCHARRFPLPDAEWYFCRPRRFRFDFAWVPWKIAMEVNGGIWTKGRHSGGAGQLKDFEKMNLAAANGWRVIHCTPSTILTGFEFVERCLPRPLDK